MFDCVEVSGPGYRRPMSTLPVRNSGDRPLCLFTEPYGKDFWLNPGERFVVQPPVGIDARFDVTVEPNLFCVWVYESGGDKIVVDYEITDENGTELKCGHQRPAENALPASKPG
jgi:hypothetical protein